MTEEVLSPYQTTVQGDYKKTEPSFQYFSKSRNFYKFHSEDLVDKVFHYLVHREGRVSPDPLSTTTPEKLKVEGWHGLPHCFSAILRRTEERTNRKQTSTEESNETWFIINLRQIAITPRGTEVKKEPILNTKNYPLLVNNTRFPINDTCPLVPHYMITTEFTIIRL